MNIVGEPPKRAKIDYALAFDNIDLEKVKFPHDDPLVITPVIGNSSVKRVLVDNGASVDILFYDAYEKMGYSDTQLTPSDMPIYGFNNVETKIEGMIQLPEDLKQEFVRFLRNNRDVFAWTAADMPGIDPSFITHKLNVNPVRKPIKQKKRNFAPESNQEVGGQGDKAEEPTNKEKPKEYWLLFFDGASKTKGSGAGLVLQSPDGFTVEYAIKLDFPTTNNEAEYEALIAGLGLARTLRVKNLKMALFEECLVEYVPREENAKADALSQFASSDDEVCSGSVYYQVLRTPSIEAKLVAPIDTGATWMDEIKLYLQNGHLPPNADEARKLQVRALKYVLIEGILYRKSFVIPYLRCLRSDEAREALREVHEGVCGQHLGGRALAHKVTRLGFYWPDMLKHAQDYVKRCDRCQRFAPIVRQPPEMLTSINTPIPFAMWGMDILGPFPLASAQRKFLLVAIDYFTKWIEAKPLAKITTKQVAQFVWENIICRVEKAQGSWADEVLPILWAYRTTCKVSTGATPFQLAYGAEAVVPLEITHTSSRVQQYEPEANEEGMRLALDMIDEIRDEAHAKTVENQKRASYYYNLRVKERYFREGDLVLRKIEASGVGPKGKMAPNWEGPYQVKAVTSHGSYKLQTLEGVEVPRSWHATNLKIYYI
ncbi:uncharacterized protein LOC135149915 [Daucus carota subsp. sativus]|uniref:uncharacterized protein LOC135149915 n=1 Tax=Daucus carota subsp. sativus TaxID=79200 RepID=UPI003082F9AF